MTEPTDSLTRLAQALAEEGHTKRGAARLDPLLGYALHTWKQAASAGEPEDAVRARIAATARAAFAALAQLSDPEGVRSGAGVGPAEADAPRAFDLDEMITAAAILSTAKRAGGVTEARRVAEHLNRSLPLIGLEMLPAAQVAEAAPTVARRAEEYRASGVVALAPLPGMASALLTLLTITPPAYRDAFRDDLTRLLTADGAAPSLAWRWARAVSVYVAEIAGRMQDMSTDQVVGTA